jgi:hypothetical protein
MERGAGGAHACDVEIGTIQATIPLCNALLLKYFSFFNFPSTLRNKLRMALRGTAPGGLRFVPSTNGQARSLRDFAGTQGDLRGADPLTRRTGDFKSY